MAAFHDSTSDYLNHLTLQNEDPSYDYLQKICHAQLNTFPFENISKLLYFRNHNYNHFDIPSFEQFTTNYTKFNFGGTCYTLNANLMRLLKSLGFDCYHIMLGEEHMGIIVKIDHERFYIDCGAAAPFFKPVRFESDFKNTSSFGRDEVHLLPEDPERNAFKYVRFTNGEQSGKTWKFNSRKEAKLSDFNGVMVRSNKPDAPFMTILRCQFYQTGKQRSVSLVNNKFGIRYSMGETVVRTLTSKEEIKEVISEEFLLPKLPVIEAIEVLESLPIDIFALREK
ncbi:arylamine N-acetyltransferase [Jeotgalibacillus proteolyticus]|uniref:Arylamine N-acetyltransferase n=1 Tax=Jeotgalibacillus proteolyticus TaxID=2082395 RepID=A0A2S5G8L3_9BACL|nr:arylamine N-acetyltransferase [Jeotgalibacillus proteolyticus]PPA69285.1 arylamine N-acetyltransferase [Jeotgalibacillus proteolyticus]